MNVHKHRKTFKMPGYAKQHGKDTTEDKLQKRVAEAMKKGEREFTYREVLIIRYNGGMIEWCRATNPALIGR